MHATVYTDRQNDTGYAHVSHNGDDIYINIIPNVFGSRSPWIVGGTASTAAAAISAIAAAPGRVQWSTRPRDYRASLDLSNCDRSVPDGVAVAYEGDDFDVVFNRAIEAAKRILGCDNLSGLLETT